MSVTLPEMMNDAILMLEDLQVSFSSLAGVPMDGRIPTHFLQVKAETANT